MRERLIELIKQGKNKTPCQNDCDGKVCKDCENESIADHLLANDVVKVVRCKDCKYYTPIKLPSSKWESKTLYCTRNINAKMNENDFCSYGELKELNNNA